MVDREMQDRFIAHYREHPDCVGISCDGFRAEMQPPAEELSAEDRRRRMAANFGVGRHYANAQLADFPEYVRVQAELGRIDDAHMDDFQRAYGAGGIWTWSASGDGPGWLLIGPTGVGKTHLAAARMLEWDHCGLASFITSADLLDAIKRSWDRSVDAANLLQQVDRARLVVLDDLGAERTTEWSTTELVRYFDRWCSDDAGVIVTSNLDLEGIGRRYGPRLMSRLAELTRPHVMTGTDRRLHRRPRIVR